MLGKDRKRILCCFNQALAIGVFFIGKAVAQPQPTFDRDPELIEISGSRLVSNDFLLGRTVVDRATLDRRRPSDLTEALSFEAGVYVNRPGGAGNVATLHLRGAEPNYTLVMIDGIAITDTTDSRGGSFDLAGIDPSTIDRIEILQGAALPLYGPGALAGIVNIHTRTPSADETTIRLGGETDFDGFSRINGGLTIAANERVSLQSDLAYSDTGRLQSGGRAESLQLISKTQIKLTDAFNTRFFLRISETEEEAFPDDSGGYRLAVFRDLDTRATDQLQLALLGTWDAGGSFTGRTSVSWFQQNREEASPGVFPGTFIPPNGADTDLERFHWQTDMTMRASQNLAFLFGVSYEHEDGSSQGYLVAPGVVDIPFDLVRETVGGFAESKLQLSQNTLLHGAVRVDDVSGIEARASVSLGIRHVFSNHLQMRGNFATGFRPPSFFSLGHPLTGNPDLKVEKARMSDISMEYRNKAETLVATLSLFYNRFQDQVDFDEATFTHVNRDELTVNGAELRLAWVLTPVMRLTANASYLDIDIKGIERKPRNRPNFLLGVSATYQPSQDYLFTINGQVRGEQFASSFVTGPLYLDSYSQIDAVAVWKATKRMDISLKLLNALDEEIEEAVGVPSPGRSVRLGLRFQM